MAWLRMSMAGRGLALAATLACVACGPGGAEPADVPPPDRADLPPSEHSNILLYVIDTLRADSVGFADGSVASTPNIDEFAAEAIVFDRVYSTSSWTRTAMASLFTGTYPTRHQIQGRNDTLGPELATLAETLSSGGYATSFITANPNTGSFFGFDQGFDQMVEVYGRRQAGVVGAKEIIADSSDLSDRAIEWLNSVQEPFFLAVLAVDPHTPYDPPSELIRQVPLSIPIGTEKRMVDLALREWPSYQGEISSNDRSFGRLLDALATSGRLERTVVALTSDHGEEFLDHGGLRHGRTLHEEVIRVPLVIRPAGPAREPLRSTSLASLIDVAPTLLQLVGMEFPDPVDGVALLDAETGLAPHPRKHVFASLKLDGRQVAAIGDGEWKLMQKARRGGERLFRLATDPDERIPVRLGSAPAVDALTRLRPLLLEFVDELARGEREAPAPELPEDARRTLEALGYLEPTE